MKVSAGASCALATALFTVPTYRLLAMQPAQRGFKRVVIIRDMRLCCGAGTQISLTSTQMARCGSLVLREGAVALYSMASSSVNDAPRGMNFLYDLHRFNVAVSRARARAYVVASPQLIRVLCRTPKQIRLVNALCEYVESACCESDGS